LLKHIALTNLLADDLPGTLAALEIQRRALLAVVVRSSKAAREGSRVSKDGRERLLSVNRLYEETLPSWVYHACLVRWGHRVERGGVKEGIRS
jgi:hypothetical protein